MSFARTSPSLRVLLVLVAVSAVAAACTGLPAATPASTPATTPAPATGGAAPTTTPAPATEPVPTPLPSATPDRIIPRVSISPFPGDGASVPAPVLAAVVADAARRTGTAPADVTVVTAKGVTWPNGALGCPQPGFMYTQMVQPGYQVVVEAGGTRLDYRVGMSGAPQLCENPPGPG